MKRIIIIIFLISIFSANNVYAHKVSIFAWNEGDTVYTESSFYKGNRVKKGKIIVYDLSGKKLLEGETNDNGEYSFKSPIKGTLKIVIDAGVGHRAEWTLKSDEAISDEKPKENIENKEKIVYAPLSQKDIQQALEIVLDKRFNSVSFKDILGGIGYILGLLGMAAYFNYRKKSKE